MRVKIAMFSPIASRLHSSAPAVPSPAWRRCTLTLLLAVAPLVLGAATARADGEYTISDLGILGGGYNPQHAYGQAINNVGQIAGYGDYSSTRTHAFLYSGQMHDLGTLLNGFNSDSYAYDLNDAGIVVGTSDGHAFSYSGGLTDVGAAVPHHISSAQGINAGGQIVGYAYDDGSYAGSEYGFLYDHGQYTELPTLGMPTGTKANAINDLGQIVGRSYCTANQYNAFLYSGGVMQDLGSLGGQAEAHDINNAGQVVGSFNIGASGQRAFLHEQGVMHDLGTLSGCTRSSALAINRWGDIVGWSDGASDGHAHAFIYRDGQMLELQTLVDSSASPFWILEMATGINDAGQITGTGRASDGNAHVFLLTPVPEPGTLTILAMAGAFLLTRRR